MEKGDLGLLRAGRYRFKCLVLGPNFRKEVVSNVHQGTNKYHSMLIRLNIENILLPFDLLDASEECSLDSEESSLLESRNGPLLVSCAHDASKTTLPLWSSIRVWENLDLSTFSFIERKSSMS